jgi:DNA-binding winged helix-turn-helix (wHTH) protein
MERVHAQPQAPVRLDLDHEQCWRGTEVLRLRPKSFAVLRHLVAQAGRVVPSDVLLQEVWPDTAVSDGVLKVCLHELRQALGDTAQAPQYIETVPRRGYRWIGPLAVAEQPAATAPRTLLAVGREAECARLHAWLAQARRGRRQVGFITGEAGIGKTTLVDTVLAQVASQPDLVLARGQCIETTALANPTCRSWRPWGGLDADRTVPGSWPS